MTGGGSMDIISLIKFIAVLGGILFTLRTFLNKDVKKFDIKITFTGIKITSEFYSENHTSE